MYSQLSNSFTRNINRKIMHCIKQANTIYIYWYNPKVARLIKAEVANPNSQTQSWKNVLVGDEKSFRLPQWPSYMFTDTSSENTERNSPLKSIPYRYICSSTYHLPQLLAWFQSPGTPTCPTTRHGYVAIYGAAPPSDVPLWSHCTLP